MAAHNRFLGALMSVFIASTADAIEPRDDLLRWADEVMPYISDGAPAGGSLDLQRLTCKLTVTRVRLAIIQHAHPALELIPPRLFGPVGRELKDIYSRIDDLATNPPTGCQDEARELLAEAFTLTVESAPAQGWVGVATLRLLARQYREAQ